MFLFFSQVLAVPENAMESDSVFYLSRIKRNDDVDAAFLNLKCFLAVLHNWYALQAQCSEKPDKELDKSANSAGPLRSAFFSTFHIVLQFEFKNDSKSMEKKCYLGPAPFRDGIHQVIPAAWKLKSRIDGRGRCGRATVSYSDLWKDNALARQPYAGTLLFHALGIRAWVWRNRFRAQPFFTIFSRFFPRKQEKSVFVGFYQIYSFWARMKAKKWCTRRGSNPPPTAPEAVALSK